MTAEADEAGHRRRRHQQAVPRCARRRPGTAAGTPRRGVRAHRPQWRRQDNPDPDPAGPGPPERGRHHDPRHPDRTGRAEPVVRGGLSGRNTDGIPGADRTGNLDLARRLHRLPDANAVDDVIDRLGLNPYAHRRARTLSQGNAQRLGLAKAILHQPQVLILDEPTNALDPAGVVEIRELIRGLADGGVTVFVSSHVLTEVARTADRLGIIHDGQLIRELDTAELARLDAGRLLISARDLDAAGAVLTAAGHRWERTSTDTLAIGDPDAVARPDDIASLLVRAGCPPTRLVVQAEDLESYFLRLTDGRSQR